MDFIISKRFSFSHFFLSRKSDRLAHTIEQKTLNSEKRRIQFQSDEVVAVVAIVIVVVVVVHTTKAIVNFLNIKS